MYALMPTPEGKFVAVHLEKVTFARAEPADDGGILARFLPEHSARALQRIVLAVGRRTRGKFGGWYSKNAAR